MRHRLRIITALLLACTAASARAQTGVPPRSCDYRACGLLIAPTWNGLAVVRGDGSRVANLNFFWTRDVSDAVAGGAFDAAADSARAQARRAVTLRRVGATFTDAGFVTLAAAATAAIARRHSMSRDAIVAAAGAGAIMISVPLQFAADGALSRAVWWHNARYSR